MRHRRFATAIASTLLLVACGSESSTESPIDAGLPATTDGITTVPAVVAATEAPVATPPVATVPPATAAIMPDVVCMNLQDAQDLIQEYGVFFSRSVDATGEDRFQVLDSNWIVLAQEPAPGTPIGEFEAVLAVVKYGEPGSEAC